MGIKKKILIMFLVLALAFLVVNVQFLMMNKEAGNNESNASLVKNATNATTPAKNITAPAKNITAPAKNASASASAGFNISRFFSDAYGNMCNFTKAVLAKAYSGIVSFINFQANSRNVSIETKESESNKTLPAKTPSFESKKTVENVELIDSNFYTENGSISFNIEEKTAGTGKLLLGKEIPELKITKNAEKSIDLAKYILNPKNEELEYIVFKQQNLSLELDGSVLAIKTNENSSEQYKVVVYATNGDDIVTMNLNVKVIEKFDLLSWLSNVFESAKEYSSKHLMLVCGAAVVVVIVLIFASGFYKKIFGFFFEEDSEKSKIDGKKNNKKARK